MRILVAGAGAGKTSTMAKKVMDRFRKVTDGKIIYVITYTNAARDRIRESIVYLHGTIPKQIKVETFHAFLLREIIFPFHHLLYDKYFTSVSTIKLPNNYALRNKKIKELEINNIIHVEKVTQVSKWIISKKSNDKKYIKMQREKIISFINTYLDSVFIDEAQDIDKEFSEVIQALDESGVDFFLVGDPKQDIRGRKAFRDLMDKYSEQVKYKKENHRCPVNHIKLANLYVSEKEKQIAQTSIKGEIEFVLESDINPNKYVKNGPWDYVCIHKKNKRYITHSNDKDKLDSSLMYELGILVKMSGVKEKDIDRIAYFLLKKIKKEWTQKSNWQIFSKLEKCLGIKLSNIDKSKLWNHIDNVKAYNKSEEGVLVQSIDKIKGLEGDQILFILTEELAPYFFKEKKEQNKMLNYLYVALTRAKRKLVILLTIEVEEKYGKETVLEQIGKFDDILV